MKKLSVWGFLCLSPLLLSGSDSLAIWPQSNPQADRMKLSGAWERETPSGKYILKINSTWRSGAIQRKTPSTTIQKGLNA